VFPDGTSASTDYTLGAVPGTGGAQFHQRFTDANGNILDTFTDLMDRTVGVVEHPGRGGSAVTYGNPAIHPPLMSRGKGARGAEMEFSAVALRGEALRRVPNERDGVVLGLPGGGGGSAPRSCRTAGVRRRGWRGPADARGESGGGGTRYAGAQGTQVTPCSTRIRKVPQGKMAARSSWRQRASASR
jgi:hypothetical protein